MNKRARGDMISLVGFYLHLESCQHYLRGSCWIPFAISERLIHTGHLLVASTLADKRKLSPGPNLPRILTVPKSLSWFHFLGYKNAPMERMYEVFGELTWDGALPRPALVLAPDDFADQSRQALDMEENEFLWQENQGVVQGPGTGPDHRLRSRDDNRVSLRDERVGSSAPLRSYAQDRHRHDHRREHSRRHRDHHN